MSFDWLMISDCVGPGLEEDREGCLAVSLTNNCIMEWTSPNCCWLNRKICHHGLIVLIQTNLSTICVFAAFKATTFEGVFQ